MHPQKTLVVLISKDTLCLFRLAGHEIAALDVVMADNNHDLEESIVQQASYLENLLHQGVDESIPLLADAKSTIIGLVLTLHIVFDPLKVFLILTLAFEIVLHAVL